MNKFNCLLLAAVSSIVLFLQVLSVAAASPSRIPPLTGPITRAFDLPEQNWAAGHRGIDFAGSKGEQVLAASAGRVTWAGQVGGVTMVTITHSDGLRSTYQPVSPSVEPGQQVSVGAKIGSLLEGHQGCPGEACLHFGVLDKDKYLNPQDWLGGTDGDRVRLLPMNAHPRKVPLGLMTGDASGPWPVPGVVTCEFGPRTNPITGNSEIHDGTDIGAPCGTPIKAWSDGVVTFAQMTAGYGNRVVLAESPGNETSYSHLQGFNVAAGQRIRSGDVVGFVGNTGYSTGCHLHFSVVRDGKFINPRQIVRK